MNDEEFSGEVTEAAAPVENEAMESQEAVEQPRTVPVDALQAERAERQKLQEEVKLMKDYMSLIQNQKQPQQRQPDPVDAMSDDDVMTVGEMKKVLAQKEGQFNTTVKEMQMTMKYPDYQDIVTKHLPEVLRENPSLRQTLEQTQDYELAYILAKKSDGYKKSHSTKKRNADAERILNNAGQSGSLSSVGTTSPINTAKRYSKMSDDEFRKEVSKNIGYF